MQGREQPNSIRWAAASGLAVVVLFGAGNALWAFEMPAADASAAEVVDFYRGASARIVVGASLSMVAVAALVLFASAMRRVIVEATGGDLIATTAFGGALLGAGAGLGAETVNMAGALRAEDGTLTEPLGQALFQVSYVLGFNAAGIGIGIFALGVAVSAWQTDTILPRWLSLLTALAGVSLLTPLSELTLAPSVFLLAAISIWLMRAATGRRAQSRA